MIKLALLALPLLSIVVALWLYTPDRSKAVLQARYDDAATSYVLVAGITVRVRDTGPRGAPAVILLHGFGASLETWEPWALALSRKDRVIRFDLPGFGLTGSDPEKNYSDARAMQILAELMDRLDVARADVIGNSLGGRIAWNFAAAFPDRVNKLVLISPDGFASPGFEYGKAPALPLVMQALPYTLPNFMLRMNLAVAYADKTKLTAAIIARYADMMRAPGDRQAMLDRMRQTVLEDPRVRLKTIRAPTLILWGERDGMIPFSNAAHYIRDIPNAVLVPLPTLGHVPFEEAPDISLPPMKKFLGG